MHPELHRYLHAVFVGLKQVDPFSFIVAKDRTVLACAAAVSDFLEQIGLISLSSTQQLRLRAIEAHADLEGAMNDLCARPDASGAEARVVRVMLHESNEPWIAVVRRLSYDPSQPSVESHFSEIKGPPLCWLAFRTRNLFSPPQLGLLTSAFDLTQREAEVVRDLIQGRSVEQQAAIRGITNDAVRFHMKNIYRKTGCRTQTQLVLLVIALLGPVMQVPIKPERSLTVS